MGYYILSWILICHIPQIFWIQIKNRGIPKNSKNLKLRFSDDSQASDKEFQKFDFWKTYQLLYYLCIVYIIYYFHYTYEGEFWYIISP